MTAGTAAVTPTQCGVGKCTVRTIVMHQRDPVLHVTRGVCDRHRQVAKATAGWVTIWEDKGKWQ